MSGFFYFKIMIKKKSPIKWLEEELKEQGFLYDLDIEVANDMFRECIKKAFIDGCLEENYSVSSSFNAEQYFKETYGSI